MGFHYATVQRFMTSEFPERKSPSSHKTQMHEFYRRYSRFEAFDVFEKLCSLRRH
jgi:hypothetical protein